MSPSGQLSGGGTPPPPPPPPPKKKKTHPHPHFPHSHVGASAHRPVSDGGVPPTTPPCGWGDPPLPEKLLDGGVGRRPRPLRSLRVFACSPIPRRPRPTRRCGQGMPGIIKKNGIPYSWLLIRLSRNGIKKSQSDFCSSRISSPIC
jgi:hypothetical protein